MIGMALCAAACLLLAGMSPRWLAAQLTAGAVLAGLGLGLSRPTIAAMLTEDDLLALERDAFVALARDPASIARVAHMLKTGKPLRN
jgi:3-hydroxyacyl-CoA dehydrogenase